MSSFTPSPPHPMLKTILRHLAAQFRGPGDSPDTAPQDALDAIAAYAAQTPVEYLLVSRLLALSLGALYAMSQAIEPAFPARQQLQFLARANALSRSAQQIETALAKARQSQPTATAPRPGPAESKAVPAAADPPPLPRPATTSRNDAALRHADDALQALIDQVLSEHPLPPFRSLAPSRTVTPSRPDPRLPPRSDAPRQDLPAPRQIRR